MTTQYTVGVRFTGNSSSLNTAAKDAVAAEREVGRAGQQAGDQATRGLKPITSTVEGIGASMRRTLGSLVAGIGVVQTIRSLGSMADEYANIGAQLRLASGGTVSFAQAQEQALGVAQRTASSLQTASDLIGKLSTSFRSLGGDAATSFKVAVGLAETISQAVALSGASSEAAKAAITQLGQGLASGTLRGDELNSVLEQTPRLAQAIAQGMGVSIGQLRALGAQGQITAKIIVEALLKQKEQLAKEYSQLPLTIGRAWSQLQNSVLSYVGKADQANGISRKLADAISFVAQHVDDVARAVVTLGEVVATVYASKMLYAGAQWIASLAAQSAAVDANGVAITGWAAKTSASFAAAKANIGLIGIAFNILGAAIVGWQIGTYLRDQFLAVRLAAIAFVDGTLTLWEKLKQGSQIAWEAIKQSAIGAINSIRSGLSSVATYEANLLQKLPGGGELARQLKDVAAKLKPATSAADDFKSSVAAINAEAEKNIAAIHKTTGEMADYEIAQDAAKKATHGAASAQEDLEAETKKLLEQMNAGTAATSKATQQLLKYNEALDKSRAKLADVVDAYAGKLVTPDVKAWNEYADAVQKAAAAAGEQIAASQQARAKGLISVAEQADVELAAQAQLSDGLGRLKDAYALAADEAQRKMNVGEEAARQMYEEARSYGMTERAAAIYRAGLQVENNLRQQGVKYSEQFIEQQKQAAQAAAANVYDLQKQADFAKQVAQEYSGFWENAAGSISKAFGDLITGQTRTWKDFFGNIKSIAKQFVSDIISQFIRLRVLGPLLSGAMGAVGGWLGIAGQFLGGSSITQSAGYYGGGSVIGSSPGAVGSSSSTDYGSYVQTTVGAYKQLQSMFGGGSGVSLSGGYISGNSYVAGPGFGTGSTGLGVNMPNGTVLYGNGTTVTPYSPYGGTASFGGYSVPYASVAGGLLGAYYGAHQGDGSFGTAGSTVAYGALGAGIAGTAAGVAGGASVSAAAGSAFGGVAAGASWIPIVGWIAALAALVDHFSGGKVFGTKYRTDASDVSLNIGADGSSADASVHQWKYRSQLSQAFGRFGGILLPSDWGDKDKKFKDVPVTPEMTAAAKQLYDNIEKTLVDGARKLSVDVPAMLDASISAQSTYDKKGKLKSTDYVVDYMGRTWKEATADAAAQRLGAEAVVKVVQQSIGQAAQTIAEQFRSDAATLLDGANLMLEAQSDINRGSSLLALGATATLAQVVAFTKTMQADGEALADTYNRLVQASAAYLQFVGQFAPANNTFGGSLQAIAKQMQANIDQANQLAQAAGLQHAKESDLANIHQYAAQQAAAAIAQLSSAAEDLAAKLYNVTGASLAAVNAQIDKLTSKVQTAAQLAIGDKSPLNDKQKLDVALQGLRSGVTSADDVLALGRKLYSSSADYTGLYDKVQQILGLPGAGQAGTGGITDALKQYNTLIGQRDQYQAQADAMTRFNDAKTLAQYVADISTTHGIGYGEAASGLGFSLNDLAKDLGITNIAGYLDNLKLADIPGATMDASASIVDAIRQLGRDLIQTISGGPLVTPGPVDGTKAIETDPEIKALLQQLLDQMTATNGNTGAIADTNAKMARQGANAELNGLVGSTRNAGVTL